MKLKYNTCVYACCVMALCSFLINFVTNAIEMLYDDFCFYHRALKQEAQTLVTVNLLITIYKILKYQPESEDHLQCLNNLVVTHLIMSHILLAQTKLYMKTILVGTC